MARVLLITNPAAARTDPRVVRTVCAGFAAEGWEVDVAGTTRPGDASRIAAQGVAEGADVIAVYGGDGTTMQAVTAMVGRGIPLALIPGGTGNLLAGNLRLPRDPRRAARVVTRGVSKRIDLGYVERAEGRRYFAVACGAGFDAELMAGTATAAKRRWGMAAYIARALETIPSVSSIGHRITVDGERVEVDAASVLVANCGEIFPPYLRLREGIVPDDGLLDVVVLKADGFLGSAAAVWRVLRGPTNGSDRVRFMQGRNIIVECDQARPVQLDGEPAGVTPFAAGVLPAALEVLVEGS